MGNDHLETSFNAGLLIVEESTHYTKYHMENATGKGEITSYPIFPGIALNYNDMHMLESSDSKVLTQDILEINYCYHGQFECQYNESELVYLQAGDLSVSTLKGKTHACRFPLSHYHGVSFFIDVDEANEFLQTFFPNQNIDIHNLKKPLKKNFHYMVEPIPKEIDDAFLKLKIPPTESSLEFLKLDVLTLILYLNKMNSEEYYKIPQYFKKDYVAAVRSIYQLITTHPENHYTLEELSEEFSIPLTSMKKIFREIYGRSIYNFRKSYRISLAGELLILTDLSVTEIAGKIGYSNPSKFSNAFFSETGKLPLEYRKHSV